MYGISPVWLRRWILSWVSRTNFFWQILQLNLVVLWSLLWLLNDIFCTIFPHWSQATVFPKSIDSKTNCCYSFSILLNLQASVMELFLYFLGLEKLPVEFGWWEKVYRGQSGDRWSWSRVGRGSCCPGWCPVWRSSLWGMGRPRPAWLCFV